MWFSTSLGSCSGWTGKSYPSLSDWIAELGFAYHWDRQQAFNLVEEGMWITNSSKLRTGKLKVGHFWREKARLCWLYIFLLLMYSDDGRTTFWGTFGWTEGMALLQGGTVGESLVWLIRLNELNGVFWSSKSLTSHASYLAADGAVLQTLWEAGECLSEMVYAVLSKCNSTL